MDAFAIFVESPHLHLAPPLAVTPFELLLSFLEAILDWESPI